jgi:hypothetical protein
MPQAEFAYWRRSSYSDGESVDQGDCVEVAFAAAVGIRDSKDPEGGLLAVTPTAWAAFLGSQR